jgi:AcrR family transcriptional regulator
VSSVDAAVLGATIDVLSEGGWDKLSLERVAEAAGVSRVTLWRQGVTREVLVEALLVALSDDYRDAMWPVLTAAGTGRERLERALAALCDVAERHLDLLLASDTSFHEAWDESRPRVSFLEPFIRIAEDGVADGSLRRIGEPRETADLLFNTVCWSYVHLRGRHGWKPTVARRRIVSLALDGIAS